MLRFRGPIQPRQKSPKALSNSHISKQVSLNFLIRVEGLVHLTLIEAYHQANQTLKFSNLIATTFLLQQPQLFLTRRIFKEVLVVFQFQACHSRFTLQRFQKRMLYRRVNLRDPTLLILSYHLALKSTGNCRLSEKT